MSFSAGTTAKVYLNGYDISSYLRSGGFSGNRDMLDTTTLGLNDRAFTPGLRNSTFNAEGFFDGSEDAIDQLLAAALGHGQESGDILTYLPYGDAAGNRGYGIDGDESGYNIASPVDGTVTINMQLQSSVGNESIRVLHPLGAVSVTGNVTGLDQSASSANGGSGYLQVTAMDRDDLDETLDVLVQDSADDITYADLITFAQVTAVGAQRVEVAGTVDRYVRARHVLGGTTPSATYSLAFHRN